MGTGQDGARVVVIREATPSDAEGIARVHAASWRETYGRFVDDPDTDPWFDADRRIEMWRENLRGDTLTTVVAALDERIIGFAAAQQTPAADDPRPEELTMLYVLAAEHGTGTGQALLDTVLDDRPVSLWVAADNPRARAFYRRNRFEPDGATSAFGPIAATVRLLR